MKDLKETCKLAVVQAAPVMFQRQSCVEKALDLIAKAAEMGAELIVFPELFIPGYPYGMTYGFTVGHREEAGRQDWKAYYDNSIVVPGEETDRLAQAAKQHGVYVSIGVSERDGMTGTLYNTNLVFTPDGRLDAVHRKLKPTGAERVVWGDADRNFFPVTDSPWGPIGSMICWESYMPLARVALYQKGRDPLHSPPIPMITKSGRAPSAILRWRDDATLSTATCTSPGTCTPKISLLWSISTSWMKWFAAAEAVSLTPMATM